jgi:hypothetical protein
VQGAHGMRTGAAERNRDDSEITLCDPAPTPSLYSLRAEKESTTAAANAQEAAATRRREA